MISVPATFSTAGRILRQLHHDKRTVAMILVLPAFLLTIVWAMYDHRDIAFDRIGLTMLGIFPFVIMFLLTSIAMLRERTSGTLERFLTLPLAKVSLLFGYGIAFGVAAIAQAVVATTLAYGVLGLDTKGDPGLTMLVSVMSAFLGVALGLLCSAFARSEFQAVQFMPAAVLPQLLLCGLFVAREDMAGWLEGISNLLPLTYTVDSLDELGAGGGATGDMWVDLAVVAVVAVAALVAASATLRRKSG
jgi:ABC-2 type transport system permease protein